MILRFNTTLQNQNGQMYYECLYDALYSYCSVNGIEIIKDYSYDKPGFIWIDDVLKGYYIINDYPSLNESNLTNISQFNPEIIFKNTKYYSYNYNSNVISGGYFSPLLINLGIQEPKEIVNRNIDIMCRMCLWDKKQSERTRITNICDTLKNQYNIRTLKTDIDTYKNELKNTKVGYNWRGFSTLNFRLIEYLAYGICIISDNLDANLREDIKLEHDINCIFCSSPDEFKKETISLLNDKEKMNRMSKNNYELYKEKLTPYKMGEWYIKKLTT